MPLAVGRRDCNWRQLACSALDADGRDYQVLFTSWSSTVVAAAVLAGMAVSVLPESALRHGMKVLSQADGFPPLPPVQIGLMKRTGAFDLADDGNHGSYHSLPRQHFTSRFRR